MELLGPIVEVIKCFGGPTCRYIDRYRKLEDHVNELRRRVKALNDRKQGLELSKEAEIRRRKVVKKEVENWFEAVQKINTDMQKIEQKFRVVSFFSRAHVGKLVCQKIEEVERIYQQGSFPEGVAVDGPPATGVTLPTPNLEGEIDEKEQIWKYLMGDEVGMVGVCGMGGIGKTTIMKHINNQLLKENAQFDKVIWVTVSKELNVFKLQDDIAESMKVRESFPTGVEERAAILMDILGRKRYVLILDDVWERFSLLDVGIPEPKLGKERKVVLTSRSIEVCNSMGCEVVKVQPLSEKESMNLFLDHVGHYVVQDQNLKDIVNLIVDQCSGLPLAIITIASSMKGVDDVCEWRNALNELEERVTSVKELDTEIFERLKFSYDRLRDSKIQNCFLYCSLYPEDFEIGKVELIESWIDEGLLDGLKTRQAMHDRGHSILNKLENNCLLERAVIEDESDDEEEAVKTHDVLRDMALSIKGHQFMVKAGVNMMEVLDEHEWTVNLEKVSLMRNLISEIPPHISPKCPHLSTLLLQGNFDLSSIPESLFKHMPGLKVLNLSDTGITHLPNSISELKSLNALILSYCLSLRYVPSLAELRALKKLDLQWTDIEEVPHGIEMLENLTYLSLFSMMLKELPAEILPMISHLQCLLIDWVYVRGEEVGKLRKLEILSCSFCDMQEFEKYEKSIQGKWPTRFSFQVGSSAEFLKIPTNLKELHKDVAFSDCQAKEIDYVVPNGVRELKIEDCHGLKCLSNIPSFHKATDLKRCVIVDCEGIECVVDLSLSPCNALHNIESLKLKRLCNLHELVRVGVVVESPCHAPTPPAVFSLLKQLDMAYCSRMKKLFPIELLRGLQNLEKIDVRDCGELEEIIASEEEEKAENYKGKATYILPKLKSLQLVSLPKLESICGNGVMIPADSLQHLVIFSCLILKRIPFCLPLLENGRPSPPPSLKRIEVNSGEWWESVKWDQPNARHVLSPLVF